MNEAKDTTYWLVNYTLMELREIRSWIGMILKRLPSDLLKITDMDYPVLQQQGHPDRWKALLRKAQDHIGDEMKWILFVIAQAEKAECDYLAGNGAWKGSAKSRLATLLKNLELFRDFKMGGRPAEESLQNKERALLLKFLMVKFWIIGPPQFPERTPFAVFSTEALRDVAKLYDLECWDRETFERIKHRLGLRPAYPRARLVTSVQWQRRGGKRLLVLGGALRFD